MRTDTLVSGYGRRTFRTILLLAFGIVALSAEFGKAESPQEGRLQVVGRVVAQIQSLSGSGQLDLGEKRLKSIVFLDLEKVKKAKGSDISAALKEEKVLKSIERNGSVLVIFFEDEKLQIGGPIVLFMDSSDGGLLYIYRGK